MYEYPSWVFFQRARKLPPSVGSSVLEIGDVDGPLRGFRILWVACSLGHFQSCPAYLDFLPLPAVACRIGRSDHLEIVVSRLSPLYEVGTAKVVRASVKYHLNCRSGWTLGVEV